MDGTMTEITNYNHIKESIKLILRNYLNENEILKIIEELDDATANNEYYLQVKNVEMK
jgi:hypothetical protein